ncbi:cubilin [Hyperolius riggenbachi]|uniref:cubilin n=1 Tax=Hyperolius riggenbachi TaxID=752182 RepID=UPI0035A36FF8
MLPPGWGSPCFLILIVSGLVCRLGEPLETRQGRDVSYDQPRMSTESGNLVFSVSQTKNIEFKAGSYGKIKVNDDDLTDLLAQIRKNKEEIAELKAGALGTNQSITNQIAQLSTKLSEIESKVDILQQNLNRKACSSSPCQHSGTCLNLVDSFFCLCPNNWQGSTCSDDVNECLLYGGTAMGCQNGGLCENTPGGYSCACTPEWYGPQCTSKYDDCKEGSVKLCDHGICTDLEREQPGQPKYSCVCESGWMSSSGNVSCSTDIDECNLPNPPCSQNPPVQCTNIPGSFICGQCPAGWTGTGYSCQDIDECQTNNGGCSLAPLVKCMNTMGSYHCASCPPGYEGDGHTCNLMDACSVNNGGCHRLAACAPSDEGVLPVCVCPPGYTGSGYGPSGCQSVSDICQKQNPCVNGVCKPGILDYTCECHSGWTGANCSENLNECSSNPCQNGGICLDGTDGYTCNCSSGWTGFHCETQTQACGGVLTNLNGTLSYPNNPGNDSYGPSVNCLWVIRTESDKILRITFPYFKLQMSQRCTFEFLQIHDGDSISAHMLKRFCGSTAPEELFSSHNSLFLWFQTDDEVKTGGFQINWESRQPDCGGEMSEPFGVINSPGYPGNYPPNRDCYWRISAEPGLFITFAFGLLSLENHTTCDNDYLEIRDGLEMEDPVLGKYCSTLSPPPLHTSGPCALVHFHSDGTLTDKGFHMTYTTQPSGPGCGGTFTDMEGFITSPSWPGDYTGDKQCIYIITQAIGDQLNFRFTHLDLQSSSGCSVTVIEIRDGGTEEAPLIGQYCNNTLPPHILSSTNMLWIKYKSDASATAKFRAFYQVECGGALSGNGVIRTPHYPNPYYRERTCEWIITQSEGEVVQLTFETLNLLNASLCGTNYVEVRDGPSSDSPVLHKFCGPDVPLLVYSTQRSLYVKFVTDASPTNHGFLAKYKSTAEGCGGTLTSPEGVLSSPDNPALYPHGLRCTWIISVPPGNLIRLSFNTFNLVQNYGCQNEYLEIYDNATDAVGDKIRYCGRSIHPSVTSRDSRMFVLFVRPSTAATTEAGSFSAYYISINASTACNVAYTDATGVLTSPNYPNNYPNNRECIYTITTDMNSQIMLNFTSFALQSSSSCTSDYVEIRNGGYEVSPLLGRFCREWPPLVISHSNKLWVKFRSDSSATNTGFSAHWSSATTGCGSTLTALSGGFSSPNYPMPYYENSECYWHLRASRGSQIEIQFEDFNLDSLASCNNDYLAVYNGNNTNSALLRKLCGQTLPPPIRSSASDMYVKFRANNIMSYSGFLATYRQACEGVVISSRSGGILESLNYPNSNPTTNQHCNWTIQTTAGNTISYWFNAFKLKRYSCPYDYMKLYDGPNNEARLIDTYCGESLPPGGTTNTSSLHVVFQSDALDVGQGFRLSWTVNGCGGDLSGPSGSFSSPGYPRNYPNNRECIWHITTSPGSSIQISVLEFSIEYHTTCAYDVLEIYGGPELSSPRLAQLCTPRAPENPLQVSSTGNMVTVRFKTNAYVSGRGFNATWLEVPGGCGGVLQAHSGEVHSPNYPRPYAENTECSWLIRVDPGHRVLLNFTDFDIEGHPSCIYDNVTVYDGESSDAELIDGLCGSQLPGLITSSRNTMFVRLRSDHSGQHRGFSAHFSEACGSSIVSDSIGGGISSPLYPAKYPSNQNCTWIIQASEPFNHVTLSFTDFELELGNPNCTGDVVEILDGNNDGAPSKGRYCSQVLPHPITSLSNALVIKFASNRYLNYRGFHAAYSASTSACGGDLFMENGAFDSPGYPENYPANTECVWNIISSPGNQLVLSFMSFSLQTCEGCSCDYLEIREGNSTGPLLEKFCGDTLPSNVSSVTGHRLWIKFVSDGSISGSGFRASFSHLFGRTIVGAYGQIASPMWPRPYSHRSQYTWNINVASGQIIEIRILEMDIEAHRSCVYDKLRIYDGPDTHYHLMGTYCGSIPPPALFSSGSSVTVRFSSDYSVSYRGFLLEWTAIDSSPEILPTISPGACGGLLRTGDTPMFLFSPGWPNSYASGIECTWVIRSLESTVELNILSVDIETHNSCSYDKLVIRDGDNNLAPELATICGRTPPGPIRSTGDAMFLRFITDGSIVGKGFNASYHKTCGGYLHANQGLITSTNYSGNYPARQNCTWHVLVTPGFTIAVHFEPTFEIQNSDSTCSSGDYLELRNGADGSSPPLGMASSNGRFCGRDTPSSMHTTDNELFVRFVSDGSNEGRGFKLHYEARGLACGGTIYVTDSNPSGYITSPNYPNSYPIHSDCIWTIIVPNGEAVQLDFQDQFYIESSENCSSSYLELRDGADSNQRLLARLCGNSLPINYTSLGTAMYVRFRTDSSAPRIGFKARYSIARCGGTHFGQSGIIQSPGYSSKNYPDSSACEWYFTGPTGHYLTITLESMDLQNSTECVNDYIEIREYDPSGNSLGRFCGNTLPLPLRTSDSFAYVKFVSDGSVSGRGFRIQYEASTEECGGHLDGVLGTLKSPNYPNLYPHDRVCEWRITVPEGKRVTLTINDFQLQEQQSCDYDYVAVYNGYRSQSPLLEKLCNNVTPGTVIMSSGNTMKVVFVTDGSVSSGGFLATFTAEENAVCGGLLMDPAGGNLTSPGYDRVSNYSKNLNCEWVIQNPNMYNSTTFIRFIRMQLEHHQTCLNDFLEIRLDDADGEVIRRLCGRTIPFVPIALVSPRIWVHFVSNGHIEDVGFHAEYLFTGCGGAQSGESGVLSSPNFPESYSPGSRCAWYLEAPEGHIITLSFAYFNVEYHPVCLWDSVSIVNGGSPGSPLIGQYCGTSSPGTVQSGSNKLLVIFNANHTIHGGGFYANWTTDTTGCGGTIHADSGTIRTPGWPLHFPVNSRCTWTIQTHESSHLELTFNDNFQIPDSSGHCERSFLKVWSGTEESEESLLLSACGNSAPGLVVSPGSDVKITFQSQDNSANGFSASFTSRCGVNFTKPNGRIASLNYPNNYDNNLNCEYIIQAENSMFIVLSFLSFELESSSFCLKDNVKVYGRAPPSGSPLLEQCGNTVPAPVSSRGAMSVSFTSDSDTTMHGFLATYRVIPCGGIYNRTSGVIRSPTHSFTDYHNDMNCTYLITVPEDKIIELKFNQFDVQASWQCKDDYVAVYDGSDIYGTLIDQLCGNALPAVIRSLSNNLFLVFRTDWLGTAGGWRATFRQTLGPLQGCGGYLTNSTGHFSSPDSDHDGKYERGLDCVWTIAAPVDKQIKLTFTRFLLEGRTRTTCRYDFLQIYDGSSRNSSLQGIYCGSDRPANFTSTGNFLTVWFFSDSSVEREGFNVTYEMTDLLCGGIYNATSAVTAMTSPDSYPPFTTCVWTIDAPPQENVKLSVPSFHLQPGLDCSQNYLELRDSPVGNHGQVQRFCGSETHQIHDFYSYGRTVMVTFKSQEYLAGNGLRFTYQIANCSREYNQSFGYLKSPGWPENYPHSIDCRTILRAPENHTISLFFNTFHLEGVFGFLFFSTCYDHLEVRNGSSADSPVIGTYCGNNLPNPIFPQNNVLYLHFKSDSGTSARGYEITWTSSPSGCGGTLPGDHGSFTSPGFPGSYTNSTDCEWTIVASRGRRVAVSVAAFSIDDPGDCENNYLRFYDGPLPTSPLLRTLCGLEGHIASFNATSHQVFVKFHAVYVTAPSNFRVIWSS